MPRVVEAEPTSIRRIVKSTTVAEALGIHVNTIPRYVKKVKGFPQPVRVGLNGIGFYEDEVARYVDTLPKASEKPAHNTGKPVGNRRKAA